MSQAVVPVRARQSFTALNPWLNPSTSQRSLSSFSFILHTSLVRYGLIAGNGKFPLLVLEGARRVGAALSVVAIHEETDPEIDRIAERVQWVGIGQLGKDDPLPQKRGGGKGDHGRAGKACSNLQPRGARCPHVENAFEATSTQH